MSDSNEVTELTKLHPAHVTVTRVVAAIWAAIVSVPLMLVEAGQFLDTETAFLPTGIITGIVLLIILLFVIILPKRRYNHRGYHMGADRLRIVRGYLFRSDTVVPFGRIQHIDVDQGPLQRGYGMATLTVHTAGNQNSSVSLPGLLHEDATAMREDIRAHIKRETL